MVALQDSTLVYNQSQWQQNIYSSASSSFVFSSFDISLLFFNKEKKKIIIMIWGFPDTGIVEQNSRYIVQQYVRECLKVWLHVSEKHGICMCVCLRVWVSVCGRVCIHECKCLSVPEQAGAARSCLIDILSSLFIFDAFLHPNLWSYFLLPAESAFCLSQCRHKRPKSIGDIRVERAPGRDGPPSAFTVPQLVCAVDGQALQVVPSTAPTSSSSSWGPSSSLDLGQLWFCRQAQRGKG